VVAVLALYVLSIGPVSALYTALVIPAGDGGYTLILRRGAPSYRYSRSALETAYFPLMWLCAQSAATQDAMGWYLSLWDREVSLAEAGAVDLALLSPQSCLPLNTR
jgi:hypothetical protein